MGRGNGADEIAETTVKIGGSDFVVGGWADYEIDRFQEEVRLGADEFGGRTFVTVNDVVDRTGGIGSTIARPMVAAFEGLRAATERYAERFVGGGCDTFVVPPRVATPHSVEDIYDTVGEFADYFGDGRGPQDHGVVGGDILEIPVIRPHSPVIIGKGGDAAAKIAGIEDAAREHLYKTEEFYSATAVRLEDFARRIQSTS